MCSFAPSKVFEVALDEKAVARTIKRFSILFIEESKRFDTRGKGSISDLLLKRVFTEAEKDAQKLDAHFKKLLSTKIWDTQKTRDQIDHALKVLHPVTILQAAATQAQALPQGEAFRSISKSTSDQHGGKSYCDIIQEKYEARIKESLDRQAESQRI